jgi:hypothetical protein
MGLELTNVLTASHGKGVHRRPSQSADLAVLYLGVRWVSWKSGPVAYMVAYIPGGDDRPLGLCIGSIPSSPWLPRILNPSPPRSAARQVAAA